MVLTPRLQACDDLIDEELNTLPPDILVAMQQHHHAYRRHLRYTSEDITIEQRRNC